jgi:polyprenyl P-hydroxybenzoate/phenylacrylic acid decarboxylase-like protein
MAPEKRMSVEKKKVEGAERVRGSNRIVIGISGASGSLYGVRALELLKQAGIETHLVMSRAADITLGLETDLKLAEVRALATVCYKPEDIAASISSGSFRTMGMLVAPCSVRTWSEIASGVTTSLLTRAADVTLKERRPLVLMVRAYPARRDGGDDSPPRARSLRQAGERGRADRPVGRAGAGRIRPGTGFGAPLGRGP